MKTPGGNLGLRQVDVRLKRWRRFEQESPPKGGWLRTIREALGMTTAQVARRLGVTQQTVAKLEKSEAAGTISLESLARVAAALGCKVAYAVISRQSLQKVRRVRAQQLATALTRKVSHTMKLEAQGVRARELERQRKLLAEELLRGNSRKLWQ
jgi:predicted DNA-binding mobile mystery protein A